MPYFLIYKNSFINCLLNSHINVYSVHNNEILLKMLVIINYTYLLHFVNYFGI